jgi:hypothetical protein
MKHVALLLFTMGALSAATPALASGWYLLMPLWSPHRAEPYEEMPLSLWRVADSFTDPQECQEKLRWLQQGAEQHTDAALEQARQERMAAAHMQMPTVART